MKFSYLLLTLCLVILQLHISTTECYDLKGIGKVQEGAMETHPIFKRSFFRKIRKELRKFGRKLRDGLRKVKIPPITIVKEF